MYVFIILYSLVSIHIDLISDIVFNDADAIVPDIGWSYLHDFDALRAMGDSFVSRLVSNLGL